MKKKEDNIYFPVLINLQRFPCLVVGGGNVALRKVVSLLEFNATVTVISPKICRQLSELSEEGKIKTIKKPYSREYVGDYKIVFSATDNPDINSAVRADCTRGGILLNVVDNPSLCDFILPANLRRGSLTISVSSQGKAPFYAKEMKKKLAQFVPPSLSEVTELAGDFRKRLLSNTRIKSPKAKLKAYEKFLETDWEKILDEKGKKKSRKHIQEILREFEQ